MKNELIIEIMADWAVIPVIIIGAITILTKVPKGGRLKAYSRILMSGLTAYLLAKFIAFIYQPASGRPFELLGIIPGASFMNNPGFPSDHSLFVAAITCAVWFETKQKTITVLLTVLAIAVGVGRVLALVHTPADVIGGFFIALVGSVWYLTDKAATGKVHS